MYFDFPEPFWYGFAMGCACTIGAAGNTGVVECREGQ